MRKAKFGFSWLKANAYVTLVLALVGATLSFVFPFYVAQAAGTINGRVFLDYNQNGSFDTTGTAPNYSIDVGFSGVVIRAYDSNGVQRGSATSGSTGTYSLAASGTGPYRIEFSNIPTAYESGAVGGSNASSVRFVSNGTTNNVDFSIASQKSFCQNNPLLLTNCYIDGGAANGEVLVDFPYDAGSAFGPTTMGPYQNPTTHTVMVMQTQIGPTWGLAYARKSNRVYAASYFKKHTNFGPGGPGALYEIDPATVTVTNTYTVPGATTNSHGVTNVCTGTHTVANCDNGNTGWDAVGKTALGGMAISDDESLLYVMNLQNRTLYEINRTTGAAVRWQSVPGVPNVTGSVANLSASGNLPPGAASATNVRPFAVENYNGKLYIGVVGSAETTAGTLGNLRAHVYEVDPTTFGFTRRYSVNLNYNRGDLLNAPSGTIPAEWNAWRTTFAAAGSVATGLGSDEIGYPQPVLTGIVFDEDGNMILGLRDRAGDQLGVYAPSDPSVNLTYVGESAGDTLMACGNQTSGWTSETNARCGGLGNGPQNNGQGIGNGEYFYSENWTDGTYSHNETSLGGMERIPGRPETVTTVFDPVNLVAGAFSAGARWFDNDQGDAERAYNLFTTNLNSGDTFAKANGLGDVIALCDNAPIQIGNRVWNDANQNGIQDPGETVFAGVEIELWADTTNNGIADTHVGNATTDSNGNYLFGGVTNANMTVPCGGSVPGSESVRINASSDDAEQNASGNAVNTTSTDLDFLSNQGSAPNYSVVGMRFNQVDIPAGATITSAFIEFTANDSTVSGGTQTFTIRAQNSGNPATFTTTNNSLGTTARPRTANSVSWTPGTWSNSSIQNTTDLTSLVNDILARGDWASGQSMVFFVEGAVSAAYREAESFDGDAGEAPRLVVNYTAPAVCSSSVLPETAYEIRLASNSFDAGKPLQNFAPTLADGDATANGDSRDSDGVVAPGDIVKTAFVTGKNSDNDHSYDFGFRPVGGGARIYSLGNRIWYDTDNDGIIDPSESGIPGVSVSIFLDADGNGVPDTIGSPISTITTDASGYYRFDSLAANNYVVRINPTNFGTGAVLEGYQNTTGINTADAESSGAGSNSENGVDPASTSAVLANGILSNSVTLSLFAEPNSEADVPTTGIYAGQGTFDRLADMTVDFGFYGLSLSGTIWNDRGAGADNNNGELDSGETVLPTFNVRLYDAAGTEIPVGPDGILGTADDAAGGVITGVNGTYVFECLPQGTYRVVVNPQGYASSTPTEADPDMNVDNNDNGFPDNTGLFPGEMISGIVTLTPGSSGAAGNNAINMAIGTTANPTVDFGLLLAATQVEMDKLAAFYKGSGVVIEWSTGGESDNLGFNVYRSTKGGSELLNQAPVAGSALRTAERLNITGNEYRWVDNSPETGSMYYIEDIDLNGVTTIHGPIYPSVSYSYAPEAPVSNLLTDYLYIEEREPQKEYVSELEFQGSAQEDAAGENLTQRQIAARAGVKISVASNDRYRVSFVELKSLGFNLETNTEKWQMFKGGEEVPFAIGTDTSGGKFVEFYGREFESNFTDREVYYLFEGTEEVERLRTIGEKNLEGEPTASSFQTTVVRKDRGIYLSALRNGEYENWFGAAVLSSADANQEINASDVHQDSETDATLRVKLQGFTPIDHLVNITFNGVQLGTVSYANSENREFDFDVPMSTVVEGGNNVTLRSVGGASDISLVDQISLRYSRKYKIKDGKLRFSLEAGKSVRIGGFGSPGFDLYELDESGNPLHKLQFAKEFFDGAFGFSIRPASRNREFAVFESSYQSYRPETIETNFPTAWNSRNNEADMIILAPMLFAKPADALAGLRKAEGIEARVVYIEDIYDEYNFGKKSDKAIRDFLRDAVSSWVRAPRFAVLFGDSSYDMRNYLAQEVRDIIPTRLLDTKTMETSSDPWLADFDDDGVEDISIGRLPAGNVVEARKMFEKLKRYRTQEARLIRSNLLIADNKFENYNDSLEALLPAGVIPIRLNRSALADTGLRQQILDEINGNAMVVTYTGHGSHSVWASNSVFRSTDPATLTNDKLSFYMMMTCLNGYTHNTSIDSMAETLLKSENAAVAVWASSGSTYASDQIGMSQYVTQHLFNGSPSIGDLTRAAKLTTNDLDARRTWQLIGDPSTVIR